MSLSAAPPVPHGPDQEAFQWDHRKDEQDS